MFQEDLLYGFSSVRIAVTLIVLIDQSSMVGMKRQIEKGIGK